MDQRQVGGTGQGELHTLAEEIFYLLCHLTEQARGEGHAPSSPSGLNMALGKRKRLKDISGRGSYPLVPKCYKAQFLEATRFHPKHFKKQTEKLIRSQVYCGCAWGVANTHLAPLRASVRKVVFEELKKKKKTSVPAVKESISGLNSCGN